MKKGDRVKLIATRYGDQEQNPIYDGRHGQVEGVIVSDVSNQWSFMVAWDNGSGNSYHVEDLAVVEFETADGFNKYYLNI